MRPTINKRKKRLLWLLIFFLPICFGVILGLYVLKDTVSYFLTPTQVIQGQAPIQKSFRLGGLVEKGSIERSDNSPLIFFIITDKNHQIPVQYEGILPDLFREGQGVVAEGVFYNDMFHAQRVLAKHDENYRPPELDRALKKQENLIYLPQYQEKR